MNGQNGYNGTINPPGIYVRALYDYDADDQISLSFRQGDIVQVLTQLESGWWDGIVNGERGWFPSNYCEFVDEQIGEQLDQSFGQQSDLEESDAEYDEAETPAGAEPNSALPTNGASTQRPAGDTDQEEAALFWIPQATPDGRLFYFNTLTGVSTVELPLENPSAVEPDAQKTVNNRSQSRDLSRPPPESFAGGYEREDDTDYEASVSDAEGPAKDRTSQLTARRRKSNLSDGASPATSLESLSMSSPNSNKKASDGVRQNGSPVVVQRPARTSSRAAMIGNPPREFLDDSLSVPLTWPRLVDNLCRAVDQYRVVVNNRDRAEIVRHVEDISDHLRLLLGAASGTTDNHSGFPSIIFSNKALYAHFRNMMSKFSKLVLSSHMAAADFSNNDHLGKCLQEADAMLDGVYSFVEVARQQRGEEISRLTPGFVTGTLNGGSWQSNGLAKNAVRGRKDSVDEYAHDAATEPSVQLQPQVLERLSDLRRMIMASLKRLEDRLTLREKIITAQKHKKFSNEIGQACGKVIDHYRPFLASMESINLAETGMTPQDPKIVEFCAHKQRVYTCVAELIMATQAVAAPLADEWEASRGDNLEDRVERVRSVSRALERSTFQVQTSLQEFLSAILNADAIPSPINGVSNGAGAPLARKESNTPVTNFSHHKPFPSQSSTAVPPTQSSLSSSRASVYTPQSMVPSDAEGMLLNAGSSKANKFFGEAPVIRYADMPSTTLDDMPAFLGLDYEGEIQYDTKTDPPSIKGGTLIGLVEQLTRHDKFDSLFKTSFLLTYQSFTSASELFEVLIKRWSIQPPPGLSQDEIRLWMEKKQAPIRLRIVNVLKQWIELYWMEGIDAASHELITRIYNFAKDTVASSNTPGWKPLLNVIEQRSRGEDTSARKLVQTPTISTPLPILPKNMKKLKFTDIDPTEFARQLTIIESRLYGKIKPHECLNKIWQKRPAGEAANVEPAANVKALILHSNRLTNLVAEMILTQNDLTKRANVLKHFIAVADKCLALNNLSTLQSIISALGTAPIHRLTRTWNKIGKSTAATLEKMRKLMHSTKNFAPYRQALHQANPPCIPFFGVYLTDLTFIEDGMTSLIKKTDLVNFAKRAKTAEVIREIQTYQNVGYPFKAVPELQDYILSMMQSATDVHEMYDRSLVVEPREREDEKIARIGVPLSLDGVLDVQDKRR